MSEPVYIVSGTMRSCTSMMMGCLKAGGMEVIYNTEKSKRMSNLSDDKYQMNSEFYELLPKQFREPHFPLMHRGKVVKILLPGLRRIPKGEYRILMMLRHPVEIYFSYLAAYEQMCNDTALRGVKSMGEYPGSPAHYHRFWRREYDRAVDRGIDIVTIGARTVNKRPLEQFERLAARGWPINAVKAAAMVMPAKYRFKLSDLAVRYRSWENAPSI